MSVGSGWIPDLIEVDDEGPAGLVVTLVELEASESVARVSCRKYLPESSTAVVQGLVAYIDAVVRQCRATADPRQADFEVLRSRLSSGALVTVRTAGALRTSTEFVEVYNLLDQPERLTIAATHAADAPSPVAFTGARSFTREELDGLRRTLRILHAVVVGHDHSTTTVHSWHNIRRKPLDTAVAKSHAKVPSLRAFLANKAMTGMKVDCDCIASELADLWATGTNNTILAGSVAAAVAQLMPAAIRFSGKDSMRDVFAAARSTLGSVGAI